METKLRVSRVWMHKIRGLVGGVAGNPCRDQVWDSLEMTYEG